MRSKSLVNRTVTATALAVVSVLGLASVTYAGDGYGPGRGMMHDGNGRHWVARLCILIALAALASVVTWLIVRRRPAASAPQPTATAGQTASAETILAERLARSEITPDDYRATLAALRESTPPG